MKIFRQILLFSATALLTMTCFAEGDRTVESLLRQCKSDTKTPGGILEMGSCFGYVKGLYDATRILGNVLGEKCLKEDDNTIEKVVLAVKLLELPEGPTKGKLAAPLLIGAFMHAYKCDVSSK